MNGKQIVLSLLLLVLLTVPSVVWADGGFFTDTLLTVTQAEAAADGLLSSSGQRAVLWQTSADCWDLYLEPGSVQLASAAYVLPLPVLPVVGEASGAFLDQLDAATVPVFVTIRDYARLTYGGGSSGCCGTDEAGAGQDMLGTRQEGEAYTGVSVWGQGTIGDLEYELVSTETSDALQTWLEEHDYEVPDTLAESIEPYVSEEYYFFVARIAREEDDAVKIPVLRFTLCGTPRLWYPLRLTVFSIAARLEFTLWLIHPDSAISPSNCAWQPPGEFYDMYREIWGHGDQDRIPEDFERPFEELYDEEMQGVLMSNGGRSLFLQYAGPIYADKVGERLTLLAQAGATPPLSSGGSDWVEELSAIVQDGLQVTRWRGSFVPSVMEIDLEFGVSAPITAMDALYWRHITYYNIDPPAEEGGLEGADGPDMAAIGGASRLSSASLMGPRGRLKPAMWFLFLAVITFGSWARRRVGVRR
ncbi:MAG: DUF2330 domain-containing protein [Bradymonadales bacterium]|nr:DUF2330 domain-containing protein [Bradymonadales bacterium]